MNLPGLLNAAYHVHIKELETRQQAEVRLHCSLVSFL